MSKKEAFYRWSVDARRDWLRSQGLITDQEYRLLQTSSSEEMSRVNDICSENVVGSWPMPFSVVQDFRLNDQSWMIPLVSEETSVVAALNHMAKWLRSSGKLTAKVQSRGCWGQLFYGRCDNDVLAKRIIERRDAILAYVNQTLAQRMLARGGGAKDLRVRCLSEGTLVVDILLDTVDAMGANFINMVCEQLGVYLFQWTKQKPLTAILSNHQPQSLVVAQVAFEHVMPSLAESIVALSHFAEQDVYRAVTHNKGIMNGVDALLTATGNDTRAAGAAAHAYAGSFVQYAPLATWSIDREMLIGALKMPIPCGVVGGVTGVHPMAKMALRCLGVSTRDALVEVCAGVGLMQNLAALKALSQEGITQGHMRLHMENLMMGLTRNDIEYQQLHESATAYLSRYGVIDALKLKGLLETIRQRASMA
jgi:hydroxymethylglutaryl-CoA reductase